MGVGGRGGERCGSLALVAWLHGTGLLQGRRTALDTCPRSPLLPVPACALPALPPLLTPAPPRPSPACAVAPAQASPRPPPQLDALGGDLALSVMAALRFQLPHEGLRRGGLHGHAFIQGGSLAALGGGGLRGGLHQLSTSLRWSIVSAGGLLGGGEGEGGAGAMHWTLQLGGWGWAVSEGAPERRPSTPVQLHSGRVPMPWQGAPVRPRFSAPPIPCARAGRRLGVSHPRRAA